nr:hypothetical protein CFP56_11516 [Quercus suber]
MRFLFLLSPTGPKILGRAPGGVHARPGRMWGVTSVGRLRYEICAGAMIRLRDRGTVLCGSRSGIGFKKRHGLLVVSRKTRTGQRILPQRSMPKVEASEVIFGMPLRAIIHQHACTLKDLLWLVGQTTCMVNASLSHEHQCCHRSGGETSGPVKSP